MKRGNLLGLVVTVGIAIFSLILLSVMAGQAYQVNEKTLQDISGVVTNENLTALTSVPVVVQVSKTPVYEYSEVLYCKNITSGYTAQLIRGVNYTVVSYAKGQFNITSSPCGLNTDVFLYANYTWGNPVVKQNTFGAIISGFKSIKTTGDFIPLVVLAVVAGIVLTTVFASMGGGRIGREQYGVL